MVEADRRRFVRLGPALLRHHLHTALRARSALGASRQTWFAMG